MEKKLYVSSGLTESFAILGRYFFKLLVNVLLLIIVLFVPYINLGAITGMYFLNIKMAKGEEIGWAEVLKKKYRRRIGDTCLYIGSLVIMAGLFVGVVFVAATLLGFILKDSDQMSDGLTGGLIAFLIWLCLSVFVIVSIMSVGWSLSYAYFLDKKEYLFESYRKSFRATYGYKGTIFGIIMIAGLIFSTGYSILYLADGIVASGLGIFLNLTFALFNRATEACIYRRLVLDSGVSVSPPAIADCSAAAVLPKSEDSSGSTI